MAIIRNIDENTNYSICFSTYMQDMWIDNATGVVTFSIECDGITVFTADYVPDNNGEIRLFDLRRILESYIDGVFADFTFTAKEEGQDDYSVSYRVFKTATRISENAEEFLPSFFLTTLINKKITQIGRYETLSFYPQTACSVCIQISYCSDSGIIFNLGWGKFKKSTLRRKLLVNIEDATIPDEFRRWVYGTDPVTKKKIKLPGLVKRREWEAQMYEDW